MHNAVGHCRHSVVIGDAGILCPRNAGRRGNSMVSRTRVDEDGGI